MTQAEDAASLDAASPPRDIRAAWYGVATIFFVCGLVTGAWAPQIAFAKERMALSDAALGLLLLVYMVGAVIGMVVASTAATRTGTGPFLRIVAPILPVLLLAPALSPSVPLFAVALVAFGIGTGALDVIMNGHGALVERLSGRRIMSGLHGWFSLGGFVGAAAASPLVRLLGAEGQALATSAVGLLLALAVTLPRVLPGRLDRGEEGAPLFAFPGARTLAFGLIAFIVLMAEGASLDWSAVWAREALGSPEAQASWPYAAFSFGMCVGRFAGDRFRERVSAGAMLFGGGLLWATGLALALAAPGQGAVLVGFLLFGLGISVLFPILLILGAERTRRTATEAIAAVASLGYLGLMAGPPIIGFLAEATGLTGALALVVLLGLVTAAAGPLAARRS